jgi:hypothetical protein
MDVGDNLFYHFEGGYATLPLASPGRPDGATAEVYALLGIAVATFQEGAAHYTAPLAHLWLAREAARAARARPGALAGRTCLVPVREARLPRWQPRVGTHTAALYAALGIDTVNLVHGGAVYTVLAARVNEALAVFGRDAAAAAAPSETIAVVGASLAPAYPGGPCAPLAALSRTLGVRFFRVLAGVPAGDAPGDAPATEPVWVAAAALGVAVGTPPMAAPPVGEAAQRLSVLA